MKVNNVGYNFIHESGFNINRPNGSGDYVLLLLRSKVLFIVDGKELQVPQHSFYLYRKGTPQNYLTGDEPLIHDWIHFDLEPDEENWIESIGIQFDRAIPCENITLLSDIIKTMYQEKYSVNTHKTTTLSLYLKLLLLKMSEQLSASSSTALFPYYEKMSALRAEVYNNPSADWCITSMAKKIMLSESYFQHLYKRIFGVSAVNDVIRARIEKAQYLLFSTDNSISRICEECGYKNDVHFMRQFKKITGYTPSEYRAHYHQTKTQNKH